MEPLFTNHTTMDAKACREFMRLAWGKNIGWLRLVLVLVAALAAAYGVFQLVLGGAEMALYGLLLFALSALALFLAFFGYLLRVKRYTRGQFETWGGETLEKQVLFYGNTFIQKTGLGELPFTYSQVTKMSFGRHGVVLFFGNQALYMDRWGFGSRERSEKFRLFIRNKTRGKK